MTQEEKPLFIILTPKERELLLTLLDDQVGIEPEVQACR